MKRQNHLVSAMLASTAMTMHAMPVEAADNAAGSQPPEVAEDDTRRDFETGTASTDILVTGSRIKGARATGDVITLDPQTLRETGVVDLGEAIRQLPQNFSGGQNPTVGSGAGLINSNVNSASAPNLRGLGPDATLTLLNSNRLPYDSAFAGVDISAIPLAAIERIEVLPDGASALYGSDAVAGVINVILRRNFEGVATSAQIGASTDGGNFRQQFDVVAGTTWATGGLMVAYDFASNSAILARQRAESSPLDPETTLLPAQRRHAATLTFYQELAPGIEIGLDALYSNRRSTIQTGVPSSFQIAQPEVESFSVAPSIKISLGSDWEARIVGAFGQDNTQIFADFLNLEMPAGRTTGCICNDLFSFEGGVEGPLFTLPGGQARVAFGAGLRRNGFGQSRFEDGTLLIDFAAEQEARFVYGEVQLPIVSAANNIAGIEELTVTGALRYEDFPGLDRFAAPRFGLRYSPISGVRLHGSWSRSFKAPTLFQRFTPYQTFLFPASLFGAGSDEETVFLAVGGNPDVTAERARSWTAGIEFEPMGVAGLRFGATYFNIGYTDRVVQPIPGSVVAAFNNPGFASLINRDPNATGLTDLIAGALFGLENFSGVPFDAANVVALVDNRNLNVSEWSVRGFDAHLTWNRRFRNDHLLTLDVSGAYIDSRQQVVADLPSVQLSGTIFNPPRFRGRGLVRYEAGPMSGNIALNYIGALEDLRFSDADQIVPSATLDVGISYDIIPGAGREPGLSATLTVQNVFDFQPQRIRGLGPTDTPFDSTNFVAIGRFVALGIRRRW